MEKILIMDAKNYAPDMEELYRVAVRGIIFIDGKLLMIEDKYGEVKLPGGGIDPNEDDYQALVREVKEETGYDVNLETIVPFGEIEEKRLSVHEPMIWHQFSRLYFCDVYAEQGTCDYTENEKKHGFRQVLYTLDEALEKNRKMFGGEEEKAWNQREYRTLLLIKDYMEKHGL
ncbi:MAG: NUDIX domain-containing protein [Lachnospiraceae bacterium]|nr:NUDIX domain-containing protein [Lachnospiraceae bacterium]